MSHILTWIKRGYRNLFLKILCKNLVIFLHGIAKICYFFIIYLVALELKVKVQKQDAQVFENGQLFH